ncbi:hypothetical protein Hanom_Chr15g01399331 [Helianthus anomalus]
MFFQSLLYTYLNIIQCRCGLPKRTNKTSSQDHTLAPATMQTSEYKRKKNQHINNQTSNNSLLNCLFNTCSDDNKLSFNTHEPHIHYLLIVSYKSFVKIQPKTSFLRFNWIIKKKLLVSSDT